MDNVVTGKDTVKEAVDFYIESKKIFRKASMNLRDWMSNNNSMMKEIPSDDRASRVFLKILGLTWNIENNMIGLNKKNKAKQINQNKSFKTDIIGL